MDVTAKFAGQQLVQTAHRAQLANIYEHVYMYQMLMLVALARNAVQLS